MCNGGTTSYRDGGMKVTHIRSAVNIMHCNMYDVCCLKIIINKHSMNVSVRLRQCRYHHPDTVSVQILFITAVLISQIIEFS